MITDKISGRMPNLDTMSADQLTLMRNEMLEVAKGFRALASYAKARRDKLEMERQGQSGQVSELARQTTWNKLPNWAKW